MRSKFAVSVSLSPEFCAAVNAIAKRSGVSFSAALQQAAESGMLADPAEPVDVLPAKN